MSIGGKEVFAEVSSLRISQANTSLCNIMKLCSGACSSGRKWLLSLSNCSFLSWVYLPVGVKGTGVDLKLGDLRVDLP